LVVTGQRTSGVKFIGKMAARRSASIRDAAMDELAGVKYREPCKAGEVHGVARPSSARIRRFDAAPT
jgi:hypothetical protein